MSNNYFTYSCIIIFTIISILLLY